MVQFRERQGFFMEMFSRAFISYGSRGQDLHGYFAVEMLVPGPINCTHSPATDSLDDSVVT